MTEEESAHSMDGDTSQPLRNRSRSRRALLAAVGASATAGIAGCSAVLNGGSGADGESTWAAGGPPDREGWAVTFQDDFSGGRTRLGHLGERVRAEHPCAGSGCSREENVSVEDGRLVLTTTPDGADEIPGDEWDADWAEDVVVGTPDEADYPYTHEFEWVRTWQREEWES